MRITFLTPCDDLTGGNRVIATYARELQHCGHEVLVVSNAPDPPTWRQRCRQWLPGGAAALEPPTAARGHIALSGVPHHVLPRKRAARASDVPDADVLVATWWETALWMHAMPARKGRRVHLVQGYEVWSGSGDLERRVHEALRLPNRKIVISDALAQELRAQVGPLDMAVVPNAVDLTQFDAPPRRRGRPPVVGYVYSRAAIKGADLCRDAIVLARRREPELQALAFGVDEPTPDWPLAPGTSFVHRPAQQTLADLYAACDAWLFASRRDSFGLPILEAMACRTPVIGVPTGAAPALLSQGGGLLVEQHTAAALADALVTLCQWPESAWQSISDRAHRQAHGYSWQDATQRFLAALAAPGAGIRSECAADAAHRGLA